VLNKRALDVLELQPLWRVRVAPAPMVWVRCVTTAEGQTGVALGSAAPEGMALRLLDNMVLAFQWRSHDAIQTALSDLPAWLVANKADWYWWLSDGAPPVDCMSHGLQALAAPSLVEMLRNPQAKSTAWQAWCQHITRG